MIRRYRCRNLFVVFEPSMGGRLYSLPRRLLITAAGRASQDDHHRLSPEDCIRGRAIADTRVSSHELKVRRIIRQATMREVMTREQRTMRSVSFQHLGWGLCSRRAHKALVASVQST